MAYKTKKTLIVGLLLSVILGIGLFIYVRRDAHTQIYNEPSARAREFIDSQKRAGNREWVDTDIDATGVPGQSDLDVTPCFKLTIMYPIQFSRKDAVCNYFIKLKGGLEMTAYMNDISYDSLDSDSGVMLRRRSQKLYTEEKVQIGRVEFLIFTKKDEGPEITAMSIVDKKLFALNLLGTAARSDREKFDAMLRSVVFYTK